MPGVRNWCLLKVSNLSWDDGIPPRPAAAAVLPCTNYIRQSLTAPLWCMKYRLSCIPSAASRTFRQALAMRNHGDLLTIFPVLIQIKVQTWKWTANYYSPTPLLIIESRLGWKKWQVLYMLLLMEGRNKWKWLIVYESVSSLCSGKVTFICYREPDNLMPHKGSCHPVYPERQGTVWREKKKKSCLLSSRWVLGVGVHLHGNNVKIEDRHDCYFKQISKERCSALSGRLCFRESSDLFSRTRLRPPFPLPTNVSDI